MVLTSFKNMLQDEGAVSPVIGVILMIAVTVVLGAVVGAFVFGVGDKLAEPVPNAQIGFDYDADNENVRIYHDGGKTLTPDNTGLVTVDSDSTTLTGYGYGSNFDSSAGDSDQAAVSSAVTSGDTVWDSSHPYEFYARGNIGSGTVIELQWQSTGGDQSATLGTFEAPQSGTSFFPFIS